MMKKKYQIEVNASVEKAFDYMLGITDKGTYESWTAVFNPSSTFTGDWKLNSKMHFIGTDENGKKGGMISRIVELEPHQFVSIQHIGILDGDQEILEGSKVEQWAAGRENYTFESHGETTKIIVDIDVTEEYEEYFDSTYPLALNKLKEIIELYT